MELVEKNEVEVENIPEGVKYNPCESHEYEADEYKITPKEILQEDEVTSLGDVSDLEFNHLKHRVRALPVDKQNKIIYSIMSERIDRIEFLEKELEYLKNIYTITNY